MGFNSEWLILRVSLRQLKSPIVLMLCDYQTVLPNQVHVLSTYCEMLKQDHWVSVLILCLITGSWLSEEMCSGTILLLTVNGMLLFSGMGKSSKYVLGL
jgi:hypothetical protein